MEQIIANGIPMGFIYALVAVGLTLTWSVKDIAFFTIFFTILTNNVIKKYNDYGQ